MIGKTKDFTVKETPKPSRWDAIDQPMTPQAPTPTSGVPNKYRTGTTQQVEGEDNIARALAGAAPEICAEVIRRAVIDPFYSEDERSGLDINAVAYRHHLVKVRKELGQV